MRSDLSPAISRHGYQAFGFALHHVRLSFDLAHDRTRVQSELEFERLDCAAVLKLDGQNIDLAAIYLDGAPLGPEGYQLEEEQLVVHAPSGRFTLRIENHCHPADNTSLMGLYASGAQLFTQCEAEGFRRITWFPDRPDIMAVYEVTLRADAARYPLLLSNGNPISQRSLPDGRHETVWADPHPKPCYLFALVAGRFDCREKTLRTRSGRPVVLQVYSDEGTRAQTAWALESLERALRWDESRYGLELDLDRFMIVAARDFTMGAMENKGLNIFNAAYVLASPDTASDAAYRAIEAVIGHEYFHNWTGNRVTCRDWFQLSLKEGLTVFREQSFSADMLAQGLDGAAAQSARAVKRIQDVDLLRRQQFPEDAGPMAHPVRPESYRQISNFYTPTVYEKGAEVIRMLHTLLGPEGFRAGIDEYFRRHDGQAVTCDDFIDAMETAYRQQYPGRTLAVFRRWYEQAGTPQLSYTLHYHAKEQHCTLMLSQHNPPVGIEKQLAPGLPKPPLHIPVAVGLLDAQGQAFKLTDHADTEILELTQATQSWDFTNITSRPVVSLLRDFSAPVIVKTESSDDALLLLAHHDPDPFARWQAIQDLVARKMGNWLGRSLSTKPGAGQNPKPDETLIELWHQLIHDPKLAPDYQHRALQLMSPAQLMLLSDPMNPQASCTVQRAFQSGLGRALAPHWRTLYEAHAGIMHQEYRPSPLDAGRRSIRALALEYLLAGEQPDAVGLAQAHYYEANNLTDRLAALNALSSHAPAADSQALLAHFYTHHAQRDAQVMDAWFRLQASAHWARVADIRRLMAHAEFSLRNPNRARALIFQFCLNNLAAVHCDEAYAFWAEQILALDALNPEMAARLARGLDHWARHAEPARSGMQRALLSVQNHPALSRPLAEIIDKALNL